MAGSRAATRAHGAAVAVLVLVVAAAAAVDEDEHEDSYALTVQSFMRGGEMELSCRGLDGTDMPYEFALDPLRPSLAVLAVLSPRATCKWMYRGNYMAGLALFDAARWPEAEACRLRNGGCAVVFEDEKMYVESRLGRRLVGDLPVKRCESNWGLFSTGCSYPRHKHPYAGQVLRNWWHYVIS